MPRMYPCSERLKATASSGVLGLREFPQCVSVTVNVTMYTRMFTRMFTRMHNKKLSERTVGTPEYDNNNRERIVCAACIRRLQTYTPRHYVNMLSLLVHCNVF